MTQPRIKLSSAKLGYGEWFLREVQEGVAAADRGALVEDDEVRKLIDERYPG